MGIRGALLTELLKAFDYLLHIPLIKKLGAYCFDCNSLVFIRSYLSKRQQKAKANDGYRIHSSIIYGIPKGCIIGSLLQHWYKCYVIDICYTILIHVILLTMLNLEEAIKRLELTTNNLFRLSKESCMKTNANKRNIIRIT